MGELHDHGARTMHAGRCRTFEEVLGVWSLGGALSQEPQSHMLHGWEDSVQGLAWIRKEAIFDTSPCVRMLGFCAHSEIETKEAGLQSQSWHIRWVQHID